MNMPDNEQDKRDEKLGRLVFSISYLLYALKFVVIASLIALILLYFIHKPLWLSPIIGCTVFLIWRSFRRFVLKKIFELTR